MQALRAPQGVVFVDRAEWPIDPAELVRELRNPGSTTLPAVLPVREAGDDAFFANPDPVRVTVPLLNNFGLYLDPAWRQSYYMAAAVADTRPIGIRILDPLPPRPSVQLSYDRFEGSSLRFLHGSWRDLFEQIEAVKERIGIDRWTIAGRPTDSSSPAYRAWATEHLLPVYRELRARGYAHRDLTQ
jgi:hypothetical protein